MSQFTIIASLSMLAAVAVTSLGTGCTFNDPFQSKGQNGVAEFSLSSAQCILGCNTNQPVLLGSSITVEATVKTHTEDPLFLRVADASMGSAEPSSQSCSCSGSAVSCASTCPPGQSKSVTVSFDVQTKAAGDVPIELVDAAGVVVDSSSIVVHPAKTIEARVSSGPQGADHADVTAAADGTYTVHVGNQVDVVFKAMDDQGNDLVFTRHGVIPTYANAKALAPTTDLVDRIIGFTNQEVADALASGDAQISLAAQGASTTVKFHVVK